MALVADLHTHTIASRHAYSSLLENASYASKAGLLVLGISDHAPGLPNTTDRLYFLNSRVWPRELFGVYILRGVELNILNKKGAIDLSDDTLDKLDYAIASIHKETFPFGKGISKNTSAVIAAMNHQKVRIIGHPDDSHYPLDYDKIAKAAKLNNVALELNETSLKAGSIRLDGEKNAIRMLEACKRESTMVVVNSDSHIAISIGLFNNANNLLEKLNFPSALVVNSSPSRLKEFFKKSLSLDLSDNKS